MGNLLVLLLLPILLIYSIKRPWFGITMYYLFSILQPKYIWFWIFPPDLAITKYLVVSTFLGVSYRIVRGEYKLSFFSSKQNIWIFILFICLYISHFLSPYPNFIPTVGDSLILTTMNTIVAVYFLGQMCKPTEKELFQLGIVFAGIVVYYAYWANMQYISGEMYLYSINGRLRGPQGSTYWDENGFSVVFILSLPFLAFLYFVFTKLWFRVFILGATFAALHGLILIGSRGALLAFVIMTIYALLFLIRNKNGRRPYRLIITIIASLVLVFMFQGGQLRERTNSTVAATQSEASEPVDPRIMAWSVGKDMIFEHPLFGVGVQRFLLAAHTEFPGRTVNVAHNTFIQIAANSGLIAGSMWLLTLWFTFKQLKSIGSNTQLSSSTEYLVNATRTSLVGYIVVSIFLDLLIAEQFYSLILLSFLLCRCNKPSESK